MFYVLISLSQSWMCKRSSGYWDKQCRYKGIRDSLRVRETHSCEACMRYERDWMPVMVDTMCRFAIVSFDFETFRFFEKASCSSLRSCELVEVSKHDAQPLVLPFSAVGRRLWPTL